MLFIFKKTGNNNPYIIKPKECEFFEDLPQLLNIDSGDPQICKITPDGLFALCRMRKFGEELEVSDIINCAFESLAESIPAAIKTAVSDMVFFRLRYGSSFSELISKDSAAIIKYTDILALSKKSDIFALDSVTKIDAKLVGVMMSYPRQRTLISATLNYWMQKAALQRRNLKPIPGVLLAPVHKKEDDEIEKTQDKAQ